ncbi:MAG: hypothetical protein ACJ71R_11435 [Nitrososphaeraceae archaeon]
MSMEVEQKEKDRIDWRRGKVHELSSQGYSQREIAQILQISNGTVNRDLSILRQQAKTNIKKYIDEILPEEYEKCLVGLNAITREAWNTTQQTEDKREKIQALSLAKGCKVNHSGYGILKNTSKKTSKQMEIAVLIKLG